MRIAGRPANFLGAVFVTAAMTSSAAAVQVPRPTVTVNIPRPTINVPRPTINVPRPVVNVPKPVVNVPKPDVPKPVVTVAKPVVNVPKPVADLPKPAVSVAKPTVTDVKPAVSMTKPTSLPVAPAVSAGNSQATQPTSTFGGVKVAGPSTLPVAVWKPAVSSTAPSPAAAAAGKILVEAGLAFVDGAAGAAGKPLPVSLLGHANTVLDAYVTGRKGGYLGPAAVDLYAKEGLKLLSGAMVTTLYAPGVMVAATTGAGGTLTMGAATVAVGTVALAGGTAAATAVVSYEAGKFIAPYTHLDDFMLKVAPGAFVPTAAAASRPLTLAFKPASAPAGFASAATTAVTASSPTMTPSVSSLGDPSKAATVLTGSPAVATSSKVALLPPSPPPGTVLKPVAGGGAAKFATATGASSSAPGTTTKLATASVSPADNPAPAPVKWSGPSVKAAAHAATAHTTLTGSGSGKDVSIGGWHEVCESVCTDLHLKPTWQATMPDGTKAIWEGSGPPPSGTFDMSSAVHVGLGGSGSSVGIRPDMLVTGAGSSSLSAVAASSGPSLSLPRNMTGASSMPSTPIDTIHGNIMAAGLGPRRLTKELVDQYGPAKANKPNLPIKPETASIFSEDKLSAPTKPFEPDLRSNEEIERSRLDAKAYQAEQDLNKAVQDNPAFQAFAKGLVVSGTAASVGPALAVGVITEGVATAGVAVLGSMTVASIQTGADMRNGKNGSANTIAAAGLAEATKQGLEKGINAYATQVTAGALGAVDAAALTPLVAPVVGKVMNAAVGVVADQAAANTVSVSNPDPRDDNRPATASPGAFRIDPSSGAVGNPPVSSNGTPYEISNNAPSLPLGPGQYSLTPKQNAPVPYYGQLPGAFNDR